jgi:hypothetical protein
VSKLYPHKKITITLFALAGTSPRAAFDGSSAERCAGGGRVGVTSISLADFNLDNVYEVVIQVSDGTSNVTKNIFVQVMYRAN